MASFNTSVRQMTEMFQLQKRLSKKWPEMFQRKKNRPPTFIQWDHSRTKCGKKTHRVEKW